MADQLLGGVYPLTLAECARRIDAFADEAVAIAVKKERKRCLMVVAPYLSRHPVIADIADRIREGYTP